MLGAQFEFRHTQDRKMCDKTLFASFIFFNTGPKYTTGEMQIPTKQSKKYIVAS